EDLLVAAALRKDEDESTEYPGQDEAGERAYHCDTEVRSGCQGLTLKLRYPSEQPKSDTADPDPVLLGEDGVGHLVEEQRGEEQHGGDHPCDPVDGDRLVGVISG